MKGQTLDSVRERIDGWYAANPSKLNRPVLETVWFEIVVPAFVNHIRALTVKRPILVKAEASGDFGT